MGDFYGRAVENGIIRYSSVSQVSRMNPEEDGGCPRKWWHRYVAGRPEPERDFRSKGTECHGQTDHYLLTGEDVLGREARVVKPFLPTPIADDTAVAAATEDPDLFYMPEHGLHDQRRKRGELMHDPFKSLLFLAGFPIAGFMDVVRPFARTSIIMDEFNNPVVVENPPGTAEVIDNKFLSDPEKYAKREEEFMTLSQMVGYGFWVLTKFPETQYVRLSHLNARTNEKRSPLALKFSYLADADEIREKWLGAFTQVAETAKSVAGVPVEEEDKVPANLSACGAFGGCAFRGICKAYNKQTPLERLTGSLTGGTMASLFKKATNGATSTEAPPPAVVTAPKTIPPPPGAAKGWVEGSKAPATTAKPSIPPPPSTSKGKGTPATPKVTPPQAAVATSAPTPGGVVNAEKAEQQKFYTLPNGSLGMFLCMTGGKASFMPIDEATGKPAGKPELLDPNVPVFPAQPPAKGPALTATGTERKLDIDGTTEETRTEAETTTTAAPALAVVPPPPEEEPTTEAPPTPAAPAVEAPKRGPGRPKKEVPVLEGDWLLIDSIPRVPFKHLDSFVNQAASDLAEKNNVIDIRFPPDEKHPLAFGRWKGALAAVLKSEPPKGVWFARHGGELMEVAIEALRPLYGERVIESTK